VFKIKLRTGDKIDLSTDVNTKTFDGYLQFKSEEFFSFSENSDLLTPAP
jgi:hypothetical protein